MTWRDDLSKVTHPPAFASLAIDIGPITIVVDGSPRKLIGASFRGVSFFVEKSDLEGGRRQVNHEFPLRDENYVDDMGRRTRAYKLDGYVIGHEYIKQRDKLIDALEDSKDEGPGVLVHPYYGSNLRVTCPKFGVSEKKDEGGLAHFTLEFTPTPVDPPFPAISVSLGGLLGGILGAIASVIAAAGALALAVVLTALAVAATIRMIEAFCDAIASFASLFTGQDAALFARAIRNIRSQADIYARRPGDLVDALNAAFDASSGADPAAAVSALLGAYSFPAGLAPTRQADYFNGVVSALQTFSLLRAAQFAGDATFPSHQIATRFRNQISGLLDAVAANADVDVYTATTEVRAGLARLVPSTEVQVVSYSPPVTGPSLLIAYELYGSVALEQDLIDRNQDLIPHPGFILGGQALEVLDHG